MPASQPANFNLQEFTDNGQLLVEGRLYTYAYGTTAQKTAFTDPDGAVPHTYTADGSGGQYIALNGRGELPAPLYLGDGSYDISLKRPDGSTVWTRKADGVENSIKSWVASLAGSLGAALIGFIQAAVGAIGRTVQDKLRDYADVTDFMSPAQIADARAFTFTLDHSGAFNAALVAGKGAIRVPPGGYNAQNLTIPAGVTTISVQGASAVNNYYKRNNSTVIKTGGGDFIKGAGASMLFCARDVFIESTGQSGMCFGTTAGVETGFCFENVGISGFEKGFWAPQYSSSSFARDTSFSDCDYGLWSIKESNNTKLYNMGYNRCANGVRICGFGTAHHGMQLSLGYTGAHAATYPEYIGVDLFVGLNYVADVYHEAYGLDYSKNILFNCRSSKFGDDHYKLDTFLSNGAGLRHLRVYSEAPGAAIKSNLIEINGSVPNNCPTIETMPGQTGLVRGIKVNGRTFNALAGTRAVFDTYDVEAVIPVGGAKVSATVTAYGTTNLGVVGFDSTAITGFADMINNAAVGAAAGQFYFPAPDYHHCPLASSGKTSALFEVIADISMDGLAAAKTYALGIAYYTPEGGYRIKHVGDFKALAVPGSATFNFNAAFKVNVRAAQAHSLGVCFIPSASVDVPSTADITSMLYGKIRVRFLED